MTRSQVANGRSYEAAIERVASQRLGQAFCAIGSLGLAWLLPGIGRRGPETPSQLCPTPTFFRVNRGNFASVCPIMFQLEGQVV